jgi:glycogen debranching enzyme
LTARTPLGATIASGGVRFAVWSRDAAQLWLCLFDAQTGAETARVPMTRQPHNLHTVEVPGLGPGARYGLRADGPYTPARAERFDPDKLLVDPYAVAIDRPFAYHPRLAAPRGRGGDTAALVPKSIVSALPEPVPPEPPRFRPGGLIYEVPVRPFTIRHPDVPQPLRGTVAALAHPAVIDHLTWLRVSAVELMPVAAWIDEAHLARLGMTNGWGYNPVVFMALEPRICPGGLAELRATVRALHDAGIGVLLDVVFNHTGEGDATGPTLSLRGLDNRAYFRHDSHCRPVNDAGTGNTLACDRAPVRRLVLDSLRHFVRHAGVDGFRFDLAPVLGRHGSGFDPDAALLAEMRRDPVLADRVLIAEPWDVGPGGYQLGRFPAPFLEWNDRYRDRVRRFWRGDAGAVGPLATAMAGSGDVFPPPATRTVNFVAAHDGFTLADLVAYAEKHNEPNGEQNRDGHAANHSWNHGVEGPSADPKVTAARAQDLRALLATLFASRGTIMLTAGDEFGRTQRGNNNAYAQDNPATWLDWEGRDRALEAHCMALADWRAAHPAIADPELLTGTVDASGLPDVQWLRPDGEPKTAADWENPDAHAFAMVVRSGAARVAVLLNRGHRAHAFHLPLRTGHLWREADAAGRVDVPARAVRFAHETGETA